MLRSLLAFTLLLLAPLVAQAQPKAEFFFKEGDRIVFLGDSITEQYQYSTDIELYLTTRFPKWKLTFLNAGISGDTATGGAGRFKTHVLDEKPTAVTINFGMNDGGYGGFDQNRNSAYTKNTEAMLKAAKDAGVRVGLVSPNAVDRRIQERFKLYVETQKQFYAPLKELAEKNGAMFADQYAITRAAVEKMEADNATKVVPYYDGFHTASPGGLLMAHAILTGLHAPAAVSDLTIDVASRKSEAKACTVDKLEASDKAVSFERTDEALPFPVQADWVSLLPYVNNLKDLNWYGLKVTGLAAGKYTLLIDGEKAAEYTAEELTTGVNLGVLTTGPIHAQGQRVLQAINDKNGIVHQRFRGVVMFNIPDWLADVGNERKAQELAKRKAIIDAKQAEVYQLVQPKPHRFELKAAE